MIHAAAEKMKKVREEHPNARPGVGGSGTPNLSYHGGIGGIGVETAPKVYLVLWGSQWNNNDPSGEQAILTSFYQGVGGGAWLNSVTQYCQGVASGTITCGSSGAHAGNQNGIYAGVWADSASAAPSKPRQSQIEFVETKVLSLPCGWVTQICGKTLQVIWKARVTGDGAGASKQPRSCSVAIKLPKLS